MWTQELPGNSFEKRQKKAGEVENQSKITKKRWWTTNCIWIGVFDRATSYIDEWFRTILPTCKETRKTFFFSLMSPFQNPKVPSFSEDRSSLEMLAEVCEQTVHPCDKGCYVIWAKGRRTDERKRRYHESLVSLIEWLKEQKLNAGNMKESCLNFKIFYWYFKCYTFWLQLLFCH